MRTTTTTEMMSSQNHHRKSKKRLDEPRAGRTSFCDHLGLAEQIHRKSLDVKEMHQLLVERLKGMNHHHHPREEKEEEEMGGEEMEGGDDRLFARAASWSKNGRKEQNAEEEENFPASIRSSSSSLLRPVVAPWISWTSQSRNPDSVVREDDVLCMSKSFYHV